MELVAQWFEHLLCTQKVVDLIPALAYSPIFFLSGYLLCGSQFILFKFNCITQGWKTVPFFIYPKMMILARFRLIPSHIELSVLKALLIDLCGWLIFIWFITSKYDWWALKEAWAAVRMNTVVTFCK